MKTSEPTPHGGKAVAPRHRQETGALASGPPPQVCLPPVLVRIPQWEPMAASAPERFATQQHGQRDEPHATASAAENAAPGGFSDSPAPKDRQRTQTNRDQDSRIARAGRRERWRNLSYQLGGAVLAVALLVVVLLALLRGNTDGSSDDRSATWDEQEVAAAPANVQVATSATPPNGQQLGSSIELSTTDRARVGDDSSPDNASPWNSGSPPVRGHEGQAVAMNDDWRPPDLSRQRATQETAAIQLSPDPNWNSANDRLWEDTAAATPISEHANGFGSGPILPRPNQDSSEGQNGFPAAPQQSRQRMAPPHERPAEAGKPVGNPPSLGFQYPDTNYPSTFPADQRVAGRVPGWEHPHAGAERPHVYQRSGRQNETDVQRAPVHLNRSIEPFSGSHERYR